MTLEPLVRAAVAGAAFALAGGAAAQVPVLLQGADLALGERLIAQHKCNQCHALKWADDGKAIYRPQGRINSPARLRGMVEQCATQMNLSLFPEEVTAVAAVLNRDHYRFRP